MSGLRYSVGIALAFLPLPHPAASPWVKTIQTIKRSIVPVVCAHVGPNNQWSLAAVYGSGFFIDREGRFVTASHVIDDLNKVASTTDHQCRFAVYVPHGGWSNSVKRDMQAEFFSFGGCIQSNVDIAICRCVDNPFTSKRLESGDIEAVAFNTRELPDGTPVAFTGFALANHVPITSIGVIAGRLFFPDNQQWMYYVVDTQGFPGVSGSPVYDQDGAVVGITLMGGANAGTGLAYAEVSSAITDLLTKNPATPAKN